MAYRPGPRKRYILFRIESEHPKERGDIIGSIAYVIRSKDPSLIEGSRDRFHIILVRNGWGIMKCSEADRELATDLLMSIERSGKPLEDVNISTVSTSGSIRKLKRIAGIPLERKRGS